MSERTIRLPPDQAVFDAIAIPGSKNDPGAIAWARLFQKKYPNQFYGVGQRLTPKSGDFRCAYIGSSAITCVSEVWGDRFYAARAAGKDLYVIARSEAFASAFLTVKKLPKLNLCDLTHTATRLALGIDSAAIYSPDFKITQAWAEAIARHPSKFDGILYLSRHTNEICAVLWVRPGGRALDKEVIFESGEEFLESTPAYAVAKMSGLTLAFT